MRGISLFITEPLTYLLTHMSGITFIINLLLYMYYLDRCQKPFSSATLIASICANSFHWHRPFTQYPEHCVFLTASNMQLLNSEGPLNFII